MIDIILASKSPRRKELLEQIGIQFRCMPSLKEEIITKVVPEEVVKELSEQKARDIESQLEIKGDTVIIGADTIVAFDDKILGKPSDKEDAVNMLSSISGHKHQVYTGVTMIYLSGNVRKEITFKEKTDVFVRNLSKEDILEYVATDEPMDKAGSYGIQGKFAKYVEKINGDYNNVVGLPVSRLFNEAREHFGIDLVTGRRKPMDKVRGAIFDLDGTTLDTVESIGVTLNKVLKELGLKEHPIETFKTFAGDGQIELVKRALIASGDTELKYFEKAMQRYIELFKEGCTYNVKPYDGIRELFDYFKQNGIKIAIFSNKEHINVISILDLLFGENYFDAVLGQRPDHQKKPSGEGIDIILGKWSVSPENCIYVGDTNTDMLTGKNYGLYTIGVTWGFRTRQELIDANADCIAEHPLDIKDIANDRY